MNHNSRNPKLFRLYIFNEYIVEVSNFKPGLPDCESHRIFCRLYLIYVSKLLIKDYFNLVL